MLIFLSAGRAAPLSHTIHPEVSVKPSAVIPLETGLRLPDKEVRGLVTDSSGAPMPGVTVSVKDKPTVGTTTDLNGRYILVVPDNAVLVFSMVGFDKQEVPVSGKTSIDIRLLPASNTLGETVVVAFGTQKKEDVVGAVTTIDPAELKVPSSNLTTALAGRLAGVVAYQRSGEPGADNAEFFIRGVTTFGYKKDPLILVDGIEFNATDLARMQPDDIASFSILKDATATALYGARAANGVILISTKEGAEGKAQVTVRVENSVSMPTRNIQLADPVTYMKMANEAAIMSDPLSVLPYTQDKIDNTLKPGSNPYAYPATDWLNTLFRDYTMNQRANFNVKGGGKVARYYLAGTFNEDHGMLRVDKRNNFNNNIDLKSYLLRSNVNINVTKTTEVGVRLYGTFDDYTGPINGGTDTYHNIMRTNPVLFPAYFPKDAEHRFERHIMFGNYGISANYLNPYADMVKGYKDYSQFLMMAQFELNQDFSFITEGLSLRAMVNTTRRSYNDVSRFYNPYYYQLNTYDKLDDAYTIGLLNENTGTDYLGYAEGTKQVHATSYIQAVFNYNRTIKKKNDISGMLVFLMDNQVDANAGDLQTSLPHRNIGVSGRYTYSYDKKYFAEFDFGYNGSERFFEEKRFGFFPSVGLAWTVSREPFLEPLSHVITNLKLRATYGLVGNDAIGKPEDRFFYLSNVDMNDVDRGSRFGTDYTYSRTGVSISRYSNEEITWETSYKTNLGMDLGLFDKGNVVLDLWKEHRTHILMPRAYIPSTTGLAVTPQANLGEANSKGIDLSVDYSQSFGPSFWLQGRANFTYATSAFTVYEEPKYDSKYLSHVGYSLSQQWGYIAEHLFVDQKEIDNAPFQNFGEYHPGNIKYRDVNGDGQITTLDQVPIGYPTTPEIVFGFGFSAGYKNFDLSCFFQGLARESFWINPYATAPFVSYLYPNETAPAGVLQNQLLKAIADNYWSESNQNPYAFWPRLSATSTLLSNDAQQNTWFMRNGALLRLKTLELGYTLPRKITQRWHITETRFYFSGINLWTLSKFDLWDVEMGGNGLGYPIQKVMNLGIQVSF
ncbi:TonB-dependent receptor [Compostibacter hankyongensis]|uniref:TonB-dependent receptor n=2 Tax=Compostibacter hankyongensis TaxID=1007089 RepID=A0ABP8FNF0_9BACT